MSINFYAYTYSIYVTFLPIVLLQIDTEKMAMIPPLTKNNKDRKVILISANNVRKIIIFTKIILISKY